MRTLCTVACGPYEGSFQVAGKSVAHTRSLLKTLFNIPTDALPVVNGAPVVGEDNLLSPGDRLDFVKDDGFKGLGELLTPSEIQGRWNISEAQYRELCEMGLPTIRLAGEPRHPEMAVDEWFRGRCALLPVASPPLNSTESLIVSTLTKAGRALKASAIARRAECKDTSSFRATLSSLFKRGILKKSQAGYALPQWATNA
jgi:hypothetical protein